MQYIILSEDAHSAQELIAAAKEQNASSIVAIQFDADNANEVAASGATKVIVADLEDGALKEGAARIAIDEAKAAGEATVLLSSTRRMINAAGMIAQALGTAPVVDVKSLAEAGAQHMMYGGKINITEQATGNYFVVTMQAGAYEPTSADASPCPIENQNVEASSGVKVTGHKDKEEETVDLNAAKTIVCIGRGVNTREGFELCEKLTSAVGGAIACTRPVTETEDPFLPHSTYLGASGIVVKPDLYIGIAASGQTQHIMGMYESGKVVVINKDANCGFFKECDYGIVGDYEEVVPALIDALA